MPPSTARWNTPGTRRARTFFLCGLATALVWWALRVDVPRLTGGVKGDEATYISMAFSLAKDGDLKFKPEDLTRFYGLYGPQPCLADVEAANAHRPDLTCRGPEGIFLKRSYDLHWRFRAGWPPIEMSATAVPTEVRLDYGKSFAYALVAAPFAALFGLGGLLLLNILLLALCLYCAALFCRARLGPVAGTIMGLAFIGASVVPMYAVWLTPELLNVTLALVAYFLWLYKKVTPPDSPAWLRWRGVDLVSAFLLGVAAFSKVTNGLLIGPVLIDAVAGRRWRHGIAMMALYGAGSLGFFGMNAVISGNWNYQGGYQTSDRKYFVTHFPYDSRGTSFDAKDAGSAMTTNEATNEDMITPAKMLPMMRLNAFYFLVGRDAGLVPYFFPGVLIVLLWAARWRDSTLWQWTTFLACVGTMIGLLIFMYDTWNGGGGPVGNRYFLGVYPAMLFLVPTGESVLPALTAGVVGLACVGAMFVQPFRWSHEVWKNPERWPLRWLPVELTIIEQLPVRLNPMRGRILVSKDPEVFLYYMDGNTYYQEADGFWVAGAATTDIVVRTEYPLTRLELNLRSNVANEVDLAIGGRSQHLSLRPNESQMILLRPSPGIYAYTSYLVVWRITTSAGFVPQETEPGSTDTRHLGVFIKPTYTVDPPPGQR